MEALVIDQNINKKDQYKNTRLSNNKLIEFDKEQRVGYTFTNPIPREGTKKIPGIINDNSLNARKLLTRFIKSKMVKNALASSKDKIEINVAGVYQKYTDMWINREDKKSRMTSEEIRRLLWQLAHPKENFTETNKDYFQYELATCPFLNCDGDGNFIFVHKSFMEFFMAQYFFNERKNNNRITDAFEFNQETRFFLKSIILLNKLHLHGLDLSGLPLNNINLEGVNLTKTNLSGCMLIGANLSEANLCEADLSNANISGADLTKADLRLTNREATNFNEANCNGAILD